MKWKKVKRLALIAMITLMLGLVTRDAGSASPPEVEMQALLNADGSGRLFINSPPSLHDATWEACRPDLSSCEPFASGRDIRIDNAIPNTIFRVSGDGAVGLSPIWHGNLVSISVPSIRGVVQANKFVRPIPAAWRGGWDGDFNRTQLAACATRTGKNCLALTDSNAGRSCRGEGTVLDPKFTGKYLRVADMRFGPGTFFPEEGIGSPYGQPIWQINGQTTVAIVGRIKRATGPRTVSCGPSPLFKASISKDGVAKVECRLGCRAVLIARRGQRTARTIRKLPGYRSNDAKWHTTLRISMQELLRLQLGRTHIIVKINGERIAHRTVFLEDVIKQSDHVS